MADSQQMPLEGDLRNIALPRVLQSVAAQQSTGILTVQGEDDIVAVSCLNGQVMAADALNQTVEDGLGKVLVSQKVISAEDFATAANDHQGGSGGSLGELLVSRKLVSRKQLLDALRLQTYRLMLQVLTWRNGEFKFYGGDEVSYEEGVVPIPVDELLIRALETLGERSGVPGSVPRFDAVYRPVPPRGPVHVLGRDGDGSVGGIWITEPQELFLKKIDGRTSAVAIAKAGGYGRYQALFCLHQLLENDLIQISTAAPRPAAAESAWATQSVEPVAPVPAVAGPAGVEEQVEPEIFTPPSTGEIAPARAKVSKPPVQARPARDAEVQKLAIPPAATALQPWIGTCLAALLLVLLGLVLVRRPASYLQPFPWQENQRSTVERQLRQALFLKIDRATRSYFLMEAHYPDTLQELVGFGLLSPEDLEDPGGHSLRYSPDTESYQSYKIDVLVKGKALDGLGTSEATTGDFFLDPQFIAPDEATEKPLYLID
ncbi:MAG: DUF4388 domain-containing protein [bacterium]|nr:DUF4388 domain-containing protein [bacterium]